MITIQNQNFGVEIELTGITRQATAQVIADYCGTIGTRFMGTAYKTYEAVDNKGRRWKCMRDASITPQRRVNAHVVDANDDYLPQDFPTYEEAKEYGNEEFGPEGYVIESTSGYCV